MHAYLLYHIMYFPRLLYGIDAQQHMNIICLQVSKLNQVETTANLKPKTTLKNPNQISVDLEKV